jgi:hypothetical protein
MDKSIEELRAQRDLIKQHLEWLDRKLAEAEPAKKNKALQSAPTSPTLPVTEPSTEAPLESPEIIPDPERILAAPPPVDINRAKIGCIALFILTSALFLFLLFGLPYLLD